MDSLFRDRPGSTPIIEATPDPVRVQIQNGAGIEGLAGDVMNFVVTLGYSLEDLSTANAFDGESHASTEIIDVAGTHENRSYLLAKDLGFDPSIVRRPTTVEQTALDGINADIIVILGADFDLESVQSPETSATGG